MGGFSCNDSAFSCGPAVSAKRMMHDRFPEWERFGRKRTGVLLGNGEYIFRLALSEVCGRWDGPRCEHGEVGPLVLGQCLCKRAEFPAVYRSSIYCLREGKLGTSGRKRSTGRRQTCDARYLWHVFGRGSVCDCSVAEEAGSATRR